MLRGCLLVCLALFAGCAPETPGAAPFQGGDGETAFRLGLLAIERIHDQTFTVLDAESESPGIRLPTMYAEGVTHSAGIPTVTGLEGPVLGPDGTAGWYKRAEWRAQPDGVRDTFDLMVQTTPVADLSAGWPSKVKKMRLAWVGSGGYFEGYRLTAAYDIHGTRRIAGEWWLDVTAATDAVSYARYHAGSRFSGRFDLAGDALGHSGDAETPGDGRARVAVPLQVRDESFASYSLHLMDRYDPTAPDGGTPVSSDWYAEWRVTDKADQIVTSDANGVRRSGPFSLETRWYFGRGPAIAVLEEQPAYSAERLPPGEVWARTTGPSDGLYEWSHGTVEGDADYVHFSPAGSSAAATQGTCTGRVVVLRHTGGAPCEMEIVSCDDTGAVLSPECG